MQPREHWTSRFSFVMAAVGSAVGLGNLWRFPAVCAENGGGAFLLPYFIALVSVGIPLLILEFSVGHRMQHAAPQAVERIRPTFKWVGWWAVVGGFIIVCFYTVVMAWCLEYFIQSFKPEVIDLWKTDATGFLIDRVQRTVKDVDVFGGRPGGFVWQVAAYLAVCWVGMFLLIHRGVKQVGKVVLVTVPLPILLVVILFIRGITMENAQEGLIRYLTPQWEYLLKPTVWRAAYGQIFFSLSVGFGVMIAYASYLDRKVDITNNAFMTGLINCGFSFFAGFAVFSVLGYLVYVTGDPSYLEKGGGSLAFIAYPTALAQLPILQNFFAVLFFLTLLSLGIDSAFSIVEAITAAVMEEFNLSRHLALGLVCLLGFAGGLIYCTRNGDLYLTTTSTFIDYGMIGSALALCIVIGWFFGARKMRDYINSVSDIKIGGWWDAFIAVLAPLVLTIILVWSIFGNVTQPREKPYMEGVEVVLGWLPLYGSVVLAAVLMGISNKHGSAPRAAMVKVLIWATLVFAGIYYYPKYPAVVMGAFASVFLYGGLGYCIYRARRAKREVLARQDAPVDDPDLA
ncbi:MAG: sodium-dependent transporter [Planctomycetes bacterium]|nr:sodium-dependent transporter [Planctomycetota bacterium]